MLRLDLARSPRWLDLGHGVRLQLAPLTTGVMVEARRDVTAAGVTDDADAEALAVAMAKAIARRCALAWEGVGDADGAPLPLTPEGVDALLDVWPFFEAFQAGYVAGGLLLEQEKNGSAPSLTGASAGATTTATSAASPVRPARRKSTRR